MATDGEQFDIKQLLKMAQENAIRASENANTITAAIQWIGKLEGRLRDNEGAAAAAHAAAQGAGRKAEAASRDAASAFNVATEADRKADGASQKADAARTEASAAVRKVSDDELTKQFTRLMEAAADSVIRERLWANGRPVNGDENVEDPRMTIGAGWGDKRGTIMLYFAHHRIDMSVPRDGHPGQTMANYWGTVFSKTVRDLRREQDVTRTNARLKKDQENIYTADLLAMSLKLFRTMYPTWCAHLKPEVA